MFLGLDEGQTGTRAIVLDYHGRLLGAADGRPVNIRRSDPADVASCWLEVVGAALSSGGRVLEEVEGAGFGLSCFVWPSDRLLIESVIRRMELPCQVVLVDDCTAALRAGAPGGVGIAIVAGTGSGVAGRNGAGETFRTFSSSRLGDGGGGWTLVARVMEKVATSYLGMTEESDLLAKLPKLCGYINVPILLEAYARDPHAFQRREIVHAVFEAFEDCDSIATELLDDLAVRYAANVAAVARRLGLHNNPVCLVLSGRLLTTPTSPLATLLSEKCMEQGLRFARVESIEAAAVGAALAGMDGNTFSISDDVRQRALRALGSRFSTSSPNGTGLGIL